MRRTPSPKSKGKSPGTKPTGRGAKQSKSNSKPPKPDSKKPKKADSDEDSDEAKTIQFRSNVLEARRRQETLDEIRVAKQARLREMIESKGDKWELFFAALRRVPDRGAALDAAGLTRKELSDRLLVDTDFEKEFKRAFDDGIDSMEDEVVRRAMLGVEEPVYQGGLLVGHKTRYSDTLLMFYLEAHRKKFRSGDLEQRRPLSDEAKAVMARVFEEALDDFEETPPPPKAAARKKKRSKTGDE